MILEVRSMDFSDPDIWDHAQTAGCIFVVGQFSFIVENHGEYRQYGSNLVVTAYRCRRRRCLLNHRPKCTTFHDGDQAPAPSWQPQSHP